MLLEDFLVRGTCWIIVADGGNGGLKQLSGKPVDAAVEQVSQRKDGGLDDGSDGDDAEETSS